MFPSRYFPSHQFPPRYFAEHGAVGAAGYPFAVRYFAPHYFAARYFPSGAGGATTPATIVGRIRASAIGRAPSITAVEAG